VDRLSFSVETAVAFVRGVNVTPKVSESLRGGGSSDFYVYSVVFCS